MSLIRRLPQIIDESRIEYERASKSRFIATERIGEGHNLLTNCDNLPFMKYLAEERGFGGKINLIYADPPFYSKANYGAEIKLHSEKIDKIPVMKQKAYHDLWDEGMEEYLKMLTPRLYMMKDLLAEDGCLWLHLDWHVVHYVKIILDEIFGEKNFINEVIWNYKSGGVSKRYFARKHDTLLFYAKSPDYYFKAQQEKSYNRDFKPYRFKGVAEYKDELGWYTMVNMKDVWQINMVGRTAAERTGYVTQKPEQLIERILLSCTKEGDLCADFFGGSGTLAATAERMNRRWITCDIGRLAAVNAHKRLVDNTKNGYLFLESDEECDHMGKIDVEIDLHQLEVSDKIRLKIELKSYEPHCLENLPVDRKYLDVIEDIVKNDPLQLIDYWSIDFNYNGVEFIPEVHYYKGNSPITLSCEKIAKEFDRVMIRVIDIFGGSGFKEIVLRGNI